MICMRRPPPCNRHIWRLNSKNISSRHQPKWMMRKSHPPNGSYYEPYGVWRHRHLYPLVFVNSLRYCVRSRSHYWYESYSIRWKKHPEPRWYEPECLVSVFVCVAYYDRCCCCPSSSLTFSLSVVVSNWLFQQMPLVSLPSRAWMRLEIIDNDTWP